MLSPSHIVTLSEAKSLQLFEGDSKCGFFAALRIRRLAFLADTALVVEDDIEE